MRLWSLHPKYLDSKGLVALWREGLLAKKVLEGKTKGYKNHPQLNRFKEQRYPLKAICQYLNCVAAEAAERNYNFNERKAGKKSRVKKIPVTSGQVAFEYKHLLRKLKNRDKNKLNKIKHLTYIHTHPLFLRSKGKVESWEIQ